MNRLFYFYIATILIVTGAILSAWNKGGNYDNSHYEKLFPDLYRQKNDFKKIEITTKDENILLEKKDGKWLLPKQSNYPANMQSFSLLVEWLESLTTVSRKTNNPKDYQLLSLNSPKSEEGKSGTRITFFGEAKNPFIDMILGDEFTAYMMHGKKRYFARMASDTQSYLIEGTPALPFRNEFFIDRIQTLPVIDDIKMLKVFLNGKENYQLNNTKFFIEGQQSKDPSFLPTSVPLDYKLLYPEIATDYVRAILNKIHPIHIEKSPAKLPNIQNWIELSLKDDKLLFLTFFKKENKFYLLPSLNGIKSEYLYEIKEDDYLGILQPFSAFLTKDIIENDVSKVTPAQGITNASKHKK